MLLVVVVEFTHLHQDLLVDLVALEVVALVLIVVKMEIMQHLPPVVAVVVVLMVEWVEMADRVLSLSAMKSDQYQQQRRLVVLSVSMAVKLFTPS
jgi:hypothetical protein|tara:strand:- start:945 stop:1229 length:285 start_codon:yes stop_codon:yes gene_type:complete